MKIAMTGGSSGIGTYLIHRFEKLGHEVVNLTRCPKNGNDQLFDINNPEIINHNCEVLIHLGWRYWDVGDPNDLNFIASVRLLEATPENSKVIFLSSLSTYAPDSKYGNEKLRIEEVFEAHNGLVIRAGVLWGGSSKSGILTTISKIAHIPLICIHPDPNPILFITHYEDIFEEIMENLDSRSRKIAILGLKQPISFVELLHTINQKKRIHFTIPNSHLLRIAKLFKILKLKVPFRVDSISGVLNDSICEIATVINTSVKTNNTLEDCKEWLVQKDRHNGLKD
jgi:nucleoside-diphosphate-sugar epimerase